jgi:hypothetical protein
MQSHSFITKASASRRTERAQNLCFEELEVCRDPPNFPLSDTGAGKKWLSAPGRQLRPGAAEVRPPRVVKIAGLVVRAARRGK